MIDFSMFQLVSILSAAQSQRDAALAQKIYDRIRSVFGNDEQMFVSSTILLSNTYALSGDLHTASKMRMHMNQTGLKKEAGVSTTIVDGKIHVNNFGKKKKKSFRLFF